MFPSTPLQRFSMAPVLLSGVRSYASLNLLSLPCQWGLLSSLTLKNEFSFDSVGELKQRKGSVVSASQSPKAFDGCIAKNRHLQAAQSHRRL